MRFTVSVCHPARTILALVLMFIPASFAAANDAVAGLDAGELVFLSTDAVEMAEEELYLSASEVRVRYLFRNTSDASVTTMVAFPLPPIEHGYDSNYGFGPGNTDPVDVIGFKLWIDGREVPVSIDARATLEDGREITGLLEKWQIPLNFLAPDHAQLSQMWDRMENLPKPAMDELAAAGAIEAIDGWAGFNPLWTSHITYFWRMSFPAGATVEVRHVYAPVPSAFIFTGYDLEDGNLRDEVCMDDGFIRAAHRKLGTGGTEMNAGTAELLRYILTTANSWRGPIGRFHLTIDKESTDKLVSLCRDGIRKTGPTTFEWEAQNWQPEKDLSVLFLSGTN